MCKHYKKKEKQFVIKQNRKREMNERIANDKQYICNSISFYETFQKEIIEKHIPFTFVEYQPIILNTYTEVLTKQNIFQ